MNIRLWTALRGVGFFLGVELVERKDSGSGESAALVPATELATRVLYKYVDL